MFDEDDDDDVIEYMIFDQTMNEQSKPGRGASLIGIIVGLIAIAGMVYYFFM